MTLYLLDISIDLAICRTVGPLSLGQKLHITPTDIFFLTTYFKSISKEIIVAVGSEARST